MSIGSRPILRVGVPEDCSHGFSVVDLSIHAHAKSGAERKEFDLNTLVLFWASFSCLETLCQEEVHALGKETGAGKEIECMLPAGGAKAGFFKQFALSRFK